MIELLRRVSATDPQRAAIATHDGSVTYGALTADAEAVASGFLATGVTRAALAEVHASEVVAALAGAALASTELCLYPPDAAQSADLRVRFDHEYVFGDPELASGASPFVRVAGAVDAEMSTSVRPHLVLTTGTTGAPRGVRHDWNRLVGSVARVAPAPDQRWLLAFGLHQFAGLQVVLHTMAAGATLVAPAPRRPREGLRAIRELGVTHVSATPTYWRFLLAEMRSDRKATGPLEQITLGGEAAPSLLLEDLRAAFPTANISHVYAASEFGSTGSVSDGRAGLPASVLERGEDASVRMKVVDGELWVRSAAGMLGYYGEDRSTSDGWRATGDLVELVGDRLEFRGRLSEVINVGGVKVHPHPVEEVVSAVPGVAMVRVYGRKNAVAGAVVAVEVVPESGVDPESVDAAIRTACEVLPGAARPRSIKFVEALEVRGDKVIRSSQS